MIQPPENTQEFESLIKVVEALRGPDGCPWDKEQTHSSLAQYAIEEAHELAEAIELKDQDNMIEELGDLLLQVILHSEIGRQENTFGIEQVIESINQKMIRRHPHVFSDQAVDGTDEVMKNWSQIKEEEKKDKEPRPGFDVPTSLPALQRSRKIGAKTRKYNFDWQTPEQVIVKVEEELGELKEAMQTGKTSRLEHELGDLLFSVAQLARHLQVDPEKSLRKANRRFETRFFTMQNVAKEEGVDFSNLSQEELEAVWQKAKKRLSQIEDED